MSADNTTPGITDTDQQPILRDDYAALVLRFEGVSMSH